MQKSPPAVVLLSGGLDSATALAFAMAEGYEAYALSFRYGQRHAVELDAARRVAETAGVARHLVVDIDLRQFGGSALTSDLAVPKDRALDAVAGEIPATYVPARNTIFLSYALAWAEVLGAADIFLGVNALDYSGYPDCRPEYIIAFEAMARLATKAGVEGRPLRIHTPLITLTKREIIARGLALGVDYSLTRSCYDPGPGGEGCGHCDSCQLRLRGFAENGIADPAPYQDHRSSATEGSPLGFTVHRSPFTGRMTYAVKEIYYTLQGEGANAGRPAVFCRFAGCNLWSGREEDRADATCRFCDTEFVGTDGPGGGKFATAQELADAVSKSWPAHSSPSARRLVVCTGGEPLLQLDHAAIAALHGRGFEIAVETNGTIPPPAGLDWVCVSPKAAAPLVVTRGDELKLVFPQDGGEPERYSHLDFTQFYLQPMDGPDRDRNTTLAVAYCLAHPEWRLSLQTHKMLGIP